MPEEDNEEVHLLRDASLYSNKPRHHLGKASTGSDSSIVGLTTKEALSRLHGVIQATLDEYRSAEKERKTRLWLHDAVHHESRYTSLCWISAVALILNSVALFIAHFTSDKARSSDNLLAEGSVILVLVFLNFCLVLRENRLRDTEMSQRVDLVLQHLKGAVNSCRWAPENYPHLYSPHAPCITLQWTYRDGELVNLPWALLVSGDVIMVRPGQAVPGHCTTLQDKDGPELQARETYMPSVQGAHELFSVPTARTPYQNKLYVLWETPYVQNLRRALEQASSRPVSYFSRVRHLLMVSCIEHLALPFVLVSLEL